MNGTLGAILLGALLLIGYLIVNHLSIVPATTDGAKFCRFDTDCVPAQCCHPTGVVNADNAPDCSDTYCTMECRLGTLDCGQGEIRCVASECTAIINSGLK